MNAKSAKVMTASNPGMHKLLVTLTVLACLVFTLTINAVEITPADSPNPVELTPDFEGLGSANQLIQDKANDPQAKKKKHSWWSWLTSTSRKPANFHYIDFMELLH
jgi:hypothetical protein